VEFSSKVIEQPKDDATPEEVLTEKKAKIGAPLGSEERLFFGGKCFFEGPEEDQKEEDAGGCAEQE
jgi:hypothetical protein